MYILYIATGWPPAIAGMLLTWWQANKKVQKVTDQQTKVIQELTNSQTSVLLRAEAAYKGHGHGQAAGGGGAGPVA